VKPGSSRPLLLGHRGARPLPRIGASSEDLPAENTLAAFDYALAKRLRRIRVRRALYPRPARRLVSRSAFDGKEISATDYSDLLRGRNELACLKDVFTRFGDTAYLDIELKVGGHEAQVVGALRAKPPSHGHVISSFLPEVLVRIRQLDGALPLGYICDRPEYIKIWTELPISVFLPQHKLVSPEMIDAVHRRGLKLFTWTVNQRPDLLRLADGGVDGLISDDPALLSSTFLQ